MCYLFFHNQFICNYLREPFPVTFVTLLFGICGAMFLISTLLALCFNINMASRWYALLLICVGWGISFVTNFTLLNSLYLWLISFCFVLL